MKRKIHVSHGFNSINTNKKYSFGEKVIEKLNDNAAIYPNPPITLVNLKAVNKLLLDTYIAYSNEGSNTKGAYDNALLAWKLDFRRTAEYVDYLADGDEAMINKSGFEPTKGSTNKSKRQGVLNGFKCAGNQNKGNGIVSASVDKLTDLRAYLFMVYAKDVTYKVVGNQINVFHEGVLVFSYQISTTSSVDFTGLPSVTTMLGTAAAFNSAGIGDFNLPLSVTVP